MSSRPAAIPAFLLLLSLALTAGCGRETPSEGSGADSTSIDPTPPAAVTPQTSGALPQETPPPETPSESPNDPGPEAPVVAPSSAPKTTQGDPAPTPQTTPTPEQSPSSPSTTPATSTDPEPKPLTRNPLKASIHVKERELPLEKRTALPANAIVRLFDAFGNPVQTASGVYQVEGGPSQPIRSGNISLRVEGTQRVVFSINGCSTVASEIKEGLNTLNVKPAPIVLFTLDEKLPQVEGGLWQLVGQVRDPSQVAGPSVRGARIPADSSIQWALRDLGVDFACALVADPRKPPAKPLPSLSIPISGPEDLDAQLKKALPGTEIELQLDREQLQKAKQLER